MNNTRINAILRKIVKIYGGDEQFYMAHHENYDGSFNTFCITFYTGKILKATDIFGDEEILDMKISPTDRFCDTYEAYINIDVDLKLKDITKEYLDNLVDEWIMGIIH